MLETIRKIAEEIGPELDELSKNIYDNPELGYEEFKAAAWHTELLEKHGFDVEKNTLDLPTAFVATFDSGKPGLKVAFLSEYDALPSIGHGCGHNILGATSTGAGIALSRVIDKVGGKVVVFGTPAEETSGAKVLFAEAGLFDDCDLALMAHPAAGYTRSGSSLALVPVQFEFFGKTAHAASQPWDGVNALDAALLTMNGVNALREHMLPTSRVHGVIIKGGEAANIVPEYTQLQYYVRSLMKSYNEELVEKVSRCAEAGALATGCTLKVSRYELPYDNLISNETMNDVFSEALYELSGIEIQPPKADTGSLDAGQVSHICPTIHPYFDITDGRYVAGHTRELAECTLSDYAKQQMRNTLSALALTAYRIMEDPQLYKKVKEEFENTPK